MSTAVIYAVPPLKTDQCFIVIIHYLPHKYVTFRYLRVNMPGQFSPIVLVSTVTLHAVFPLQRSLIKLILSSGAQYSDFLVQLSLFV